MSVFTLKSQIRINCATRLSPYLRKEVEALGYTIISETDTGVEIKGTLEDCIKLNLHIRTAFRVLFLIDNAECPNPDKLYEWLVEIPWEEYIDENGYISISSFVDNPYITDRRFANTQKPVAMQER